jgi:hypothetical protein
VLQSTNFDETHPMNPYQVPDEALTPPPSMENPALPPPQPPGLVNQVRILAILMIVQGVLEVLMGLFLTGMSVVAVTLMKGAFAKNPNMPPGGPSAEVMSGILFGIYLLMGIGGLAVGLLHCVAGYKNFHFRGRTLGIIASIGGVASIITMYCFPTGVALCVYGLIVHLNGSVIRAFQMREAGFSSEEVLMAFSRYHQPLQPPRQIEP